MANTNSSSPIRPYDVGSAETPIGFFKTLFHLHDTGAQHCLPAIVKKYDRSTGIVDVIPLPKIVTQMSDGEELSDRATYSVPLYRICHGGLSIDVPVYVGETGWIIAGDRNCEEARRNNSTRLMDDESMSGDEFKGENKGAQRPDTLDLGDFAWGFFIPCFWGGAIVGSGDGIAINYAPKSSSSGKQVTIGVSGDKIFITRGDESASDKETITISDNGIEYDGKEDRIQSVVTDIRYDISTHQVQKKTVEQKIRGDFIVETSAESDWTMVEGGQAVEEQGN